jgi:hypothetical protein
MIRPSLLIAILLAAGSSAATAQTKNANAAKGNKPVASRPVLLTRISPFSLLSQASVCDELEITSAQKSRIAECKAKIDSHVQKLDRESDELGENPDEQALAAFHEHRLSTRRDIENEVETTLVKSLDRRQRIRLEQIGLQQEGASAFLRPEIQERLNMDDGQIQAIRIINAQVNQEIQRVRTAQRDSTRVRTTPGEEPSTFKVDPRDLEKFKTARENGLEATFKLRESALREISRLLTKKQRQAYNALVGEPFDQLASRRRQLGLDKDKPRDERKAP